MKMILRISATKQPAWRIIEHVYGEGDYQAERQIKTRLGPRSYSFESGYPTGDPKFDACLLLAGHHGRGKQARHIIFSGQELPNASETEYNLAIKAVMAAAEDFAALNAAGHPYIIQGHLDRFHPHCHLVMCASDGTKNKDWGPKQLKGFQGLNFLSPRTKKEFQLEPGRGAGKRRPSVGRLAYDSAVDNNHHETHEYKTATQFNYAKIMEGIANGKIDVARRTKNGKAVSVILDGKRVRLSTLRRAEKPKPIDDDAYDSHSPRKQQVRKY